ncbi:MAG: DEAD/DEAH box helicase [Clostridia bacterium]|nr:DEAD/DEAH box helicase [Clostridia bacterium]
MIEKLTEIKGIGEKRAQLFNSLGIYIPRDLMHYMPRRYMDFTDIKQLGEVLHGTVAAFCVRVTSSSCLFRAKGMQIVTCTVADATGKAQLTWFNQPYRAGAYRTGDTLYIYGRVDVHGKTIKISSPSVYTENPVIVPVYPLKKGITQSMIQNAVKGLLYQSRGNISETLPRSILEKYSLMGLEDALFALHFPQDMRSLAEAKRRLAFEDMMLFRIAMNYIRLVRKKTAGIKFNTDGVLEQYKKILPFELTEGQLETIADIQKDMSSDYAMNRLVQGDVGSGKTAVAFYAMKVAANNHMQSALLAPTEILASQHYKSLCGVAAEKDVCLLTGAMTKKQKETAYNRIKNGECLYVVGTHALLQEGLDFHSLGLIICDEQQRFGVEQREALKKKGRATDVLIMSATPIPRTLAHVMYGDVEVSKIKGMPKGRQPVRTRIVPTQRRSDMYTYL